MNPHEDPVFDAGAYWQRRVIPGASLDVVGHHSMGPIYNRQMYERRLEVLEAMLRRHVSKPVEELRILDIGCGSGFYTTYWAARGVRDYVGIDISAGTVEHLASSFPEYQFIEHDMTQPLGDDLKKAGEFDVVSVFDVLYHVVDDGGFENAVNLIASMSSASARVLVMDYLFSRHYQLVRHVVHRERSVYLETFDKYGLQLTDTEVLFHYMQPPLSGIPVIDVVRAAAFKAMGWILSCSEGLERRVAGAVSRLDARRRKRGSQVANSEFLVFAKRLS